MGHRFIKLFFSLHKNAKLCRLFCTTVPGRSATNDFNAPEKSLSPKLQVTEDKRNSLENFTSEIAVNHSVPFSIMLKKPDLKLTNTLTCLKNRKRRERSGQILLEGKLLINNAIDAGLEFLAVYFHHEKDIRGINFERAQNVQQFKVHPRSMQLRPSETSAKVMGIFKRPLNEEVKFPKPLLPVSILCDNIRDPGNLGSIIRVAASAACQNIFLMKGCVDPWETKVLKTSQGSNFQIPIQHNIDWTNISNYISRESKIFIADNSGDIEPWEKSRELISYDDNPKQIEGDPIVNGQEARTFREPKELILSNELSVPSYLYSSVKYPKENIVLYIGGETHGVDVRILELANELGGKRVKIPLENSMDSLNSSFAMSIILYEIKRQFSDSCVKQ